MPQWRFFIARLGRRIWFRAALIGALSVLLALMAPFIAPLIPYEFGKIGSSAVDNILTVLASSMLAVTTFSLTAMVTAFSGASQSGTPRATELLVEDAAAQNALSTFLGAFLFSIVGIIALKTGFYGVQGRAVLLIGTIGVIIWIVVVLLHWIGQLTHFGRMADTIERVEDKARHALDLYKGPLDIEGKSNRHPPSDAVMSVCPSRTGYVAHVDRKRLSEIADKCDIDVHLVAPSGTFVDRTRALVWLESEPSDEEECKEIADKLRSRFTVSDARDFDQDPRFGVVVLGEIASRALSPAVNDPGTAISVLSSGLRVFDTFIDHLNADDDEETAVERGLDRLVEPGLSLEEMVRDLIVPIARDGAALVEVHLRVQEVLGAVHARLDGRTDAFRNIAREAFDRSMKALDDEIDEQRLRDAHERAFGDTNPAGPFHRAR
ncbi:DUF2254 domain-containing protein [Sphingomicrobium sp. XHP0235]|uniref:DUF2254 domain-containing protein n=1 Tax=Sphingomicrobium aquimarinum TaxID=3133971 RepID=UPI0031FF28EF